MTVHASKGLEFDAVFIGGLEEGLFPHDNSSSDRDGLEEERRLMYVAITRARKRLYLSHSQTRMLHGQTRYNVKSRFFDELPEECLKWITPKQQGFGSYAPNSGAGGAYPSSARGQFGFKSETFASPPVPVQKARPRTACAQASPCSTPSLAKARCWPSKARATTRAPRSTSPATAPSGWR
jgi:DNA helicase-2/ATP-dependent DNA helicase PcrA